MWERFSYYGMRALLVLCLIAATDADLAAIVARPGVTFTSTFRIRHKDGSKISKSNPQPGDNPLDVIADYSADALRFTIITSSALCAVKA